MSCKGGGGGDGDDEVDRELGGQRSLEEWKWSPKSISWVAYDDSVGPLLEEKSPEELNDDDDGGGHSQRVSWESACVRVDRKTKCPNGYFFLSRNGSFERFGP